MKVYKCECGNTCKTTFTMAKGYPTCSIDKKSGKPHLKPKVMKLVT